MLAKILEVKKTTTRKNSLRKLTHFKKIKLVVQTVKNFKKRFPYFDLFNRKYMYNLC